MAVTDLEVPSSDRISMEPEDQSTSANMDALHVPPINKKRQLKSPTPGANRALSMTPVRGRSQTPFNVYLTRRSEDPTEPAKWRSITPFINRDDKERTPFELGKDIKAQLISHKMVFDKASVMDVSESDFEPVRYITSDMSVVDRACVMDISNVEVIYMVEEYEEEFTELEEEQKEEEQEETTKKKKPRKARKSKSMDKEDSPVSIDGEGKKKEPKTKKKADKKKKEESRSPSPPPLPKLTLKLELGGGPKMNKKMFEQKASAADAKPPAKAPKQPVAVQSVQQTARNQSSETRSDNQDIEGTEELDGDFDIDQNNEEDSERTLNVAGNMMQEQEDSIDPEDSEELMIKQAQLEKELEEAKRAAEEAEKFEEIKREIEREKKKEKEREREKRRQIAIEEGKPTPEQLVIWEKIAADEGEQFMDKIKKFTQQKRNDPKNPTFINYLPNVTAVEGQSVRLVCAVNGDDLNVKWFKGDIEIKTGDRYKITASKYNVLSLHISTCSPADTGEYSCLISNKQKKVKSTCFVSIYDISRFQDEPSVPSIDYVEDTYHYISDELMIECRVHGTPRPTVTWTRENYEIKKEHALTEEAHGIYRMIIKNPCPNDTGIYVVRAVNSRGEYERKHCVEFFVTTEKVIY